MPRPAHQLVTFSGVLGSTTTPIEQWSFGLRFPELRFDVTNQTTVNSMATAWDQLAPLHAGFVILTKVRLASVGVDGKVPQTSGGSYLQKDWTGAMTGSGAATSYYPPQCAVVVSLGTPRQGPSGKGRIFLPQPAAGVANSDLRLTTTTAQLIADKAKLFLNALKAIDAASYTGTEKGVHVVSTKGFMSPVRDVRVGRAVDTLSTRRRDVAEGYLSVTL